MDKPVFEININGVQYNIYFDGHVTWILFKNDSVSPVITTVINRIPQLIVEAEEKARDVAQADEYRG